MRRCTNGSNEHTTSEHWEEWIMREQVGFVRNAGLDIIPETNLIGQHGPYIAEPALVHAANTALGLQMPLLLTGEPGCGKSDFAWVAGRSLGHDEPLRFHVRSDTRARDLLYHYDALVRFADAQHGDRDRARDPRRYVSLRPLGAALMSHGKRSVVLIDEIDKAPRDLPNDLLHELDEGRFEIPEIGDFEGQDDVLDRTYQNIRLAWRMERPKNQPKPLVIITSNAERQLPEPFLRRCIFYHIPRPSVERLSQIAIARFPDQNPTKITDLTSVFTGLRVETEFVKPPTTAEMLNWLHALTRLYTPSEVHLAMQGFVDAVKAGGGRLSPESGLSWLDLPGIGCLLKMKEDLLAVDERGS
jgi:MoxR-like ATPase